MFSFVTFALLCCTTKENNNNNNIHILSVISDEIIYNNTIIVMYNYQLWDILKKIDKSYNGHHMFMMHS